MSAPLETLSRIPASKMCEHARPATAIALIAEETDRAERQAARVSGLRERFLEGPTLTLHPGTEFRYSFDPNEVFPLADAGTVYESSRVTDEWGVLTVESVGESWPRPIRYLEDWK